MIDFDTQLLPDSMTIPLIWLGLMVNAFEIFIPLKDSVFSAVGAYVFLWIFVYIFKLITGKDGMGEGDFKLFSAFGAWFGWQALPLILVASSIAGALIGIIIIKTSKQDQDTPLAFGPYLCVAAYFYLLYGQELIQWYLSRFLY
jgi:leader peptidase (prepilin peptidase) / N-methyltransferase